MGQLGESAPYRYEATIRLTIGANGLDVAARIAKAAAAAAQVDGVVSAVAPIVDLHHRPDLDGSLRVGAGDRERTSRGRSET